MSMMLPPGLGAPPPQGPPPGHPPSIQVGGGQDPSQGGGDAVALLKQALDSLQQAEQADTDPAEDAAIAQVAAKLKSIIAGRQKEKEAAVGISPALKLAQRANSGGGPGY